jgi:hypothetical protein
VRVGEIEREARQRGHERERARTRACVCARDRQIDRATEGERERVRDRSAGGRETEDLNVRLRGANTTAVRGHGHPTMAMTLQTLTNYTLTEREGGRVGAQCPIPSLPFSNFHILSPSDRHIIFLSLYLKKSPIFDRPSHSAPRVREYIHTHRYMIRTYMY